MGNSFQDQLLKAGLVDEKNAQQVKKAKYKKRKQAKQTQAVDEDKLAAQQARAEKVARDRELNRRRQNEIQQKSIAAQIKQLIEQSRQPVTDGDTPYNFSDAGTVKKIYISAEQHGQLSRGRLAIVKHAGQYEVIPAAAAEKIGQRDNACVIVHNKAQQQDDEDDPYADYQVPDDLMW